MLFFQYPKCSTSQKAKKFLDCHGVAYTKRDIKEAPPTPEELERWVAESGLPLRKWFNTSGQSYKMLGLKDKLAQMSQKEQLTLLAGDGMLVKRPILVGDGFVLVGFREEEWAARLVKK